MIYQLYWENMYRHLRKIKKENNFKTVTISDFKRINEFGEGKGLKKLSKNLISFLEVKSIQAVLSYLKKYL